MVLGLATSAPGNLLDIQIHRSLPWTQAARNSACEAQEQALQVNPSVLNFDNYSIENVEVETSFGLVAVL